MVNTTVNITKISGEQLQKFDRTSLEISFSLNQHEETALGRLTKKEQKIILSAKGKKFSDYEEGDKQSLAQSLFAFMQMLQIKNIPDSKNLYYKLTVGFLISSFPNLTLQEFIDAIYYGIKNISNDDGRHFHSFGIDVISKYINNYADHIRDAKHKFYLETHNAREEAMRKPKTEIEKKIIHLEYCIFTIKQFDKHGAITGWSDSFYDFMKSRKALIPILKTIIADDAKKEARERIEKDNRGIISKGSKIRTRKEIFKEIEKIKDGSDIHTEKYVTSRAKLICCETVLRKTNRIELIAELEKELKLIKPDKKNKNAAH